MCNQNWPFIAVVFRLIIVLQNNFTIYIIFKLNEQDIKKNQRKNFSWFIRVSCYIYFSLGVIVAFLKYYNVF